MSREWNCKAILDEMGYRVWDTSTSYNAKLINMANTIKDDLATVIPQDWYKFQLKKLLPTTQEIINLSPELPSAPTVAIATGGSLVDGTSYKVYVTFVIYDADGRRYMESEPSLASSAVTGTASDKTINVTALDTYGGDTSITPTTIYRNIYVSKTTSGTYGEPFYYGQITNNTATTTTITSEPTSTITPPSDTEVDQITSDHLFFSGSNRVLERMNTNVIRRGLPNGATTTNPNYFDFTGTDSILLNPQLSSSATTAQRTLSYYVFRRPHEFFYDITRTVDLPIIARMALMQGVVWLSHEHRDRDGKNTELDKYNRFKNELVMKLRRQRGGPARVRDVIGDTQGYSI